MATRLLVPYFFLFPVAGKRAGVFPRLWWLFTSCFNLPVRLLWRDLRSVILSAYESRISEVINTWCCLERHCCLLELVKLRWWHLVTSRFFSSDFWPRKSSGNWGGAEMEYRFIHALHDLGSLHDHYDGDLFWYHPLVHTVYRWLELYSY